MTQMLLFDTPFDAPIASVAPVAAASVSASPVATVANESIRGSGSQSASGNDLPETHVRGLNRMGDLARLVLLQHDLIAQQRKQQRSGRRAK